MGYSLFKVAHQVDTIGNRLKEVQDGVQDLAKFGKMVQLVSFLPFEYEGPTDLVYFPTKSFQKRQTSSGGAS